MTTRKAPTLTAEEHDKFRLILEDLFPWLLTEEAFPDGSDTSEDLAGLHDDMLNRRYAAVSK